MTKDTEIHERDYYLPPPSRNHFDPKMQAPARIKVGDKVQRVTHSGQLKGKAYTVSRIFKVGNRGQWRLGLEGPIAIEDQLYGVKDGALAADFRKAVK